MQRCYTSIELKSPGQPKHKFSWLLLWCVFTLMLEITTSCDIITNRWRCNGKSIRTEDVPSPAWGEITVTGEASVMYL